MDHYLFDFLFLNGSDTYFENNPAALRMIFFAIGKKQVLLSSATGGQQPHIAVSERLWALQNLK